MVIFCDNYQNIEEYLQHLVCDCTITLEMKVGSVLSSHFKNLSTSFLGLLLVLCNSLCVNCISSIFINIGRPRNYTTHTIKNYRKSYRNFDIYPNIVSISYRNKNPDIAHHYYIPYHQHFIIPHWMNHMRMLYGY